MQTIATYALRDIAEIAALGAFLVMIAFHRPRHRLVTREGGRHPQALPRPASTRAPALATTNAMDSSVIKAVGFVHLHVHSAYSLREGALTDRDAGQARPGRRHAGAGDHRHQQPVRRARIFGEARQERRAADHRRADDGRFRRRGPRLLAWRRAGQCARADRSPGAERGRLPQSDAPRLRLCGSIPRMATRRIFRSPRSTTPRASSR